MRNDNTHLHEIPISRRHLQYFDSNKLFACSFRFQKSITCFNSKNVVRVQPRPSKGITDLFSPYPSFRLQVSKRKPYTDCLVIPQSLPPATPQRSKPLRAHSPKKMTGSKKNQRLEMSI